MPDERLQALKRRYLESRSLEDEVEWLGARIQTGEVPAARASLAALLGDPAAIEARGAQTPLGAQDLDDASRKKYLRVVDYLESYGAAIGSVGWRFAARAALGVALLHLEAVRSLEGGYEAPDPFSFGSSAELSRAHARLGIRLADQLQGLLLEEVLGARHSAPEMLEEIASRPPELYLGHTALQACLETYQQRSSAPFVAWWQASFLPSLGGYAGRPTAPRNVPVDEALRALQAFRDTGEVVGRLGADLGAIRAEVVPALLGYHDPIHARRQRSLETASIAHPCPLPLAGEQGRVRHCSECQLNVFDLSKLSFEDAQSLIATTTTRLCVRLYRRDDGLHQTEECPSAFAEVTEREQVIEYDGFFTMPEPGFDGPAVDPFRLEGPGPLGIDVTPGTSDDPPYELADEE